MGTCNLLFTFLLSLPIKDQDQTLARGKPKHRGLETIHSTSSSPLQTLGYGSANRRPSLLQPLYLRPLDFREAPYIHMPLPFYRFS